MKLNDVIKKLTGKQFTLFGTYTSHDLSLQFIVHEGHEDGARVYRVEVLPKSMLIEESGRYNWNIERNMYDDVQVQQRHQIENKQGLKAFKLWVDSLLKDINYDTDVINGSFIHLLVDNR
jgi:hypothetical protein